ncbi:MAG: NAD-dependent epimerase/dehydratase family protein [Bacillota bacterium]
MRVLVIGGTRFIGPRLLPRLVGGGHRVVVLTRGSNPVAFPGLAAHLKADRTDAGAFKDAVTSDSWDVVIDTVAYRPEDVESVIDSLGGRIRQYVVVSTYTVYAHDTTGPRAHAGPVDFRLVPEEPVDLNYVEPEYQGPGGAERGAYSLQKRAIEKVLWGLRGRLPFAFTVARPANIEGPGDPSNRRGFYIQRVADGGPVIIPAGLNPPFRHVFVDDVAQALAAMAGNERAYGRAYNLAMEEFLFLDRTPLNPFRLPIPWRSLVLDVGRAVADLGYRSTPVRQWVAETVRWFLGPDRGRDSRDYERRALEVGVAEEYAAKYAALAAAGGSGRLEE